MIRIVPSGDTALVVELGDTVDRAISARVIALADRIEAAAIPGVVEMVPTFRSLLIHYDPVRLAGHDLRGTVEGMLGDLAGARRAGRRWRLPACYEGDFAPDLDDVARTKGLTTDEVIRLHGQPTYLVYCIGFLPGSPYLGDLPAALELPRRTSPRVRVPRGSVAIAMRQSNIYPLESPGGWHLIGRTPVRLFDPRRRDAILLAPGDEIDFHPIGRAEYDRMADAAEAGTLVIEPETRAA